MQQERMRYVVITAAERIDRLKNYMLTLFYMQEVYTESKERYEQENKK